MPARDPYLGMSAREKTQARIKQYRASKAAERAKQIATSQETGGGTKANTMRGQNAGLDSTIYRYPLKRIDNSTDCLRIQIFDNIRGGDLFGLPNVLNTTDPNNPQINVQNFAKVPNLNDIWNNLNSDGTPNYGDSGLAAEKKVREADIFLPIPQQVSDNIGAAYSQSELSPLQVAGLNATKTIIDQLKGTEKNISDRQALVDAILANNIEGIDQQTKTAINNILGATALNSLGANVSPQALISRASGQIFQQNLELLFSGVKLRTFPFIFDFAPRNHVESGVVMDIIRVIKRSASPSRQGDNALFMKSPKLFQLQYLTGAHEHPFLNAFKICVCEDISVNYTASGTYATYSDGTPVHIRMQLTFKEINPIYAEDYDSHFMGPYADPGEAVYGAGGVGY
tara:strand:+ start:654 stop:1850 length:1197 start_codon:yes stop_codon:yes gene_type:complete